MRDLLLGMEPHDFDVTTNARPEEMKEIFSDLRTYDTGLKHGTITVLIDHIPVEVTTFRIDGAYSDKRHPDGVTYTDDLIKDLSRRDFTVNAMALASDGSIVDPFGGRKDLQRGIIRCVGEPRKRFGEDALRILRAVRFSSVLSFTVEELTARTCEELSGELRFISKERIYSELKKILCGDNFRQNFLFFKKVFSTLIPELSAVYGFDQNNPHHLYALDEHIARTVENCPKDHVLRFAALLHDVGKPYTASRDDQGVSHYYGHAAKSAEIARSVFLDLKSDRKTAQDAVFLIEHHDAPAEETKEQVARKLNRYGEERYRMLIALRRADNLAQAPDFYRIDRHDRCERFLFEILQERSCFSLSSLKISGGDLIRAGVPQGPQIGRILRSLLESVLDNRIENDREALLKEARKMMLLPSDERPETKKGFKNV